MSKATTKTTETVVPVEADPVTIKLEAFGATPEVIEAIKALGVETEADLVTLTETDFTTAGLKLVQARKLVTSMQPQSPTTSENAPTIISFNGILPSIPNYESLLEALKGGAILQVDRSTVVAAGLVKLADNSGLFDVPKLLSTEMEKFAVDSGVPVTGTFYEVQAILTANTYGDLFNSIPGFSRTFVNASRKKEFLQRVEDYLWPALIHLNDRLKAWYDAWMKDVANPAFLMTALMNGSRQGMPSGMMQPPDTAQIRAEIEALDATLNRVFAGTGAQVAAALMHDASEIKKTLQNQKLPALLGVANREQMLQKLGIGVGLAQQQLEANLTQFIAGALGIKDLSGGDEEARYLNALTSLGSQISWERLKESFKEYPQQGSSVNVRGRTPQL
jgi:hypothetical protein